MKGTISPLMRAILNDPEASRKFLSNYFELRGLEAKRKFILELLNEFPSLQASERRGKKRNLLQILLGR
jgi:hypothetical protein